MTGIYLMFTLHDSQMTQEERIKEIQARGGYCSSLPMCEPSCDECLYRAKWWHEQLGEPLEGWEDVKYDVPTP